VDEAPPVRSEEAYAPVDLATFDLTPGAHEIEVVARWRDGTQAQESMVVQVIESVDGGVTGGCQLAGADTGGSPEPAGVLGAMLILTRLCRRSRTSRQNGRVEWLLTPRAGARRRCGNDPFRLAARQRVAGSVPYSRLSDVVTLVASGLTTSAASRLLRRSLPVTSTRSD
jgi:hypothetical protein